MQDCGTCLCLTEEELMLLALIYKMQEERGGKVSLSELEEESKKSGLGIEDHVLSSVNMLISERGLAMWADGKLSVGDGTEIASNSFVRLTEFGQAMFEMMTSFGSEHEIAADVAVEIEMIPDEDVSRVLRVIREILDDPEEADMPLYVDHPGRCIRIDPGRSLIIIDMLREAGCINVSETGIITMTPEQKKMVYPPKPKKE